MITPRVAGSARAEPGGGREDADDPAGRHPGRQQACSPEGAACSRRFPWQLAAYLSCPGHQAANRHGCMRRSHERDAEAGSEKQRDDIRDGDHKSNPHGVMMYMLISIRPLPRTRGLP
jgi:hypothetical protein